MNFVDRPASAGLTYSGEAIARDIFGLSTDVKPVQGVTPGSSFTEVDTGKYYIFTNDLEWTESSGESGIPEITPADEGKVLKVEDGELTFAEDGGLPDVTNLPDGTALIKHGNKWDLSAGYGFGKEETTAVLEFNVPAWGNGDYHFPEYIFFVDSTHKSFHAKFEIDGRVIADSNYSFTTLPSDASRYYASSTIGSNGIRLSVRESDGRPSVRVTVGESEAKVYSLTITNADFTMAKGSKIGDYLIDSKRLLPYPTTAINPDSNYYDSILTYNTVNGWHLKYSSIAKAVYTKNGSMLEWSNGYWYPVEKTGVPMVTSTDNGKTVKVKNGLWALADSNELPAVSSSDNGKNLTVVNGEWSAATPTHGSDVFHVDFRLEYIGPGMWDYAVRDLNGMETIDAIDAALKAGKVVIGREFEWDDPSHTGRVKYVYSCARSTNFMNVRSLHSGSDETLTEVRFASLFAKIVGSDYQWEYGGMSIFPSST